MQMRVPAAEVWPMPWPLAECWLILVGSSAEAILPFSTTGVIGEFLPVDKVAAALPQKALAALDAAGWERAARAIAACRYPAQDGQSILSHRWRNHHRDRHRQGRRRR
jgi:hypothetical protein